MPALETPVTLDKTQLSEVTLNNRELMREILDALLEDTSRQLELLSSAIEDHNAERCIRLAHYCKGACANVGAAASAKLLKDIEISAMGKDFTRCSDAFQDLTLEMSRLRQAAGTF